ncbi:MAG: hypothetical protein K6U80_14250 [Firmicutes bacterium]|nr:hypothetical protein [Bacillota bacterium]
MKNKNEKKGLLERLLGDKKEKKSSCCCGSLIIEEIPEEENANPDQKTTKDKEGNPCCG